MEGLLPEGVYDFEVFEAEEKQSAKGNDMIALNMKVYEADGRVNFVRDWLLEAMMKKLCHFCREVGLVDKYEAGTLTAQDCIGRTGKVKLKIEPGKGNFGPKNSVSDYGDDGTVPEKAEDRKRKEEDDIDLSSSEEIPFN